MSRLIDADKLLKKAITVENVNATGRTKTMVDTNDIDAAPAIDAEPVVHAYWEDRGNDMCSCSRCRFTDLYVNEIGEGSISEYRDENKYCRNCGAKMDKEKEKKL